jgi:hypothetical protein
MALSYLKYTLQGGYIHNWLVAGPKATTIPDLGIFSKENRALDILKHFYTSESGINQPPADLRPLNKNDENTCWRYYHCADDHFVDFTDFYPGARYLCAWAYSEVVIHEAQEVVLTLSTNSSADVWINNQHVQRLEIFPKQSPVHTLIRYAFKKGANKIQVRFENAGLLETPYIMALHLEHLNIDKTFIQIPTEIEPENIDRRKIQEQVIDEAYLDQDIYGYINGDNLEKNQPVTMRWNKSLEHSTEITMRLQDHGGNIYQEVTQVGSIDAIYLLARNYPINEGGFNMAVLPPAKDYYELKLQVERLIPFNFIRNGFSQTPYGTFEERQKEAIENIAWRKDNDLSTEIAKMVLGQWDRLKPKVIQKAIDSINQREDGSIINLIGLLGIRYRFWEDENLTEPVKNAIDACILNYRYNESEPGDDIMNYRIESRQILFYTCETLAGQIFPNAVFHNSQKSGHFHQDTGEKNSAAWLLQRGRFGFSDGVSDSSIEEVILALLHLVEFSDSESIVELTSILLDKIFFTLALNSWRGCLGSPSLRCETLQLKSPRMGSLAGISRLVWGIGVYNSATHATLAFALQNNYQIPDLLQNIAAEENLVWARESHPESLAGQPVEKTLIKNHDYLLSSLQDFHPGEKGCQQHLWQATLGADATVFVNHPACFSEHSAHRPNFWSGNVVLPRIIQWGNTLIAIHQFDTNDWLGFTHAHFPIYAFDEYSIRENWAFARKGNAYLALAAANGLELITSGNSAYRELRSHGNRNIWLCQMGQNSLDGTFKEFQDKIVATRLQTETKNLTITFTNLQNETISFGWDEPLIVNSLEQPLRGNKHFESPYAVTELGSDLMDIHFHDEVIRLDFSE